MGGGHVLVGKRGRALVGLESLVRRPRPDIALLELREVAVVVPLHLMVENLPKADRSWAAGERGGGRVTTPQGRHDAAGKPFRLRQHVRSTVFR